MAVVPPRIAPKFNIGATLHPRAGPAPRVLIP